jgi:hypothetical protein
MKRLCCSILMLILLAPFGARTFAAPEVRSKKDYALTEWVALIPEQDLQVLMNPPDYLSAIAEGSDADQPGALPTGAAPEELAQITRYKQALESTQVRPEFNDKAIRIPGFIVPLVFNEQNIVTTFFLVPFFGACIHQPPPPPNQIIFAEYEPGKKLDALYDAFWIEGTLHTKLIENDMAKAAYTMIVDSITPYYEE